MTDQSSTGGRLSPGAKRLALVAFVVLPAVLLFLAGEIYVRISSPHDDLWALTGRGVTSHPIADWAFVDAFSAMRGKPGTYPASGGVKTVSQAGFISTPELAVTKPANTVRIVFLGESSTAGTGTLLPDSVTWPWRTAEKLRQRPGRQRRIEFINAALGGYTTFESYGRLWSRLRFYSPDIVVLYHGWNEMYYFRKVDRIASWRTLPDGSWGLESAVPVTVYEPRWYDWLVRRSQILTKVRLRLSTALNGEAQAGAFEKTLHDDFDPRALEIFRTNLRLLQSTTRLLGMQLLVGKQATLIVPGLSEADRRRCRYELHAMSHDAHLRAFEAIYRVIEEEFPRDHIIDATPLSGVSENFYDHIHPTPLGAERTAQLMADALEPYVEAIERTAPAAAAAR